ncbi:MAG: hypothetical protein ACRDMV_24170 [Streptosporangiales bacterium]
MAWEPPGVTPSAPREWEARVRGILRVLADVHARAATAAEADLRAAEEWQRAAYERAAASADEARQQAEDAGTEQVAAARASAARTAAELAPGLASADFGAAGWTTTEFVGTGMPAYVRIGTASVNSAGPVPAVFPLLDCRGWQLWSDTADNARGFTQGVLLRAVGAADPTRLRVDAYDPRLTGMLGVLGRLTEQAPAVVPPALHSTDELGTLLADLVATSSHRATALAQWGHRDFPEWLAADPHVTEPFRLVVLLDYPAGVDARANAELVRVAGSAQERGLCLLVHYNETIASDVDTRALLDQLRPVVLEGDEVGTPELDTVPVRADPRPGPAFSAVVCDVVAGIARRSATPNGGALDVYSTRTPNKAWEVYVAAMRTLAETPAVREASQRRAGEHAAGQRASADGRVTTAERTGRQLAERKTRIDELAHRATIAHGLVADGAVLDVPAPQPESAKAAVALIDRVERQLRDDLDALDRARRRVAEQRRKVAVLVAVAAIVVAATVLILLAAL